VVVGVRQRRGRVGRSFELGEGKQRITLTAAVLQINAVENPRSLILGFGVAKEKGAEHAP